MSSRERMLAALSCAEPDHTPCCFMIFAALSAQSHDHFDYVKRQLGMGLDAVVELHTRQSEDPYVTREHRDLPGLPVRYHPEVEVKEGRVDDVSGRGALRKEYHTPAGTLFTVVELSDDWRYSDHVPFLDDYLIPRARKHLVTEPADLEPLKYLFQPPTAEDVAAFRQWARAARAFAGDLGLAVTAGWGSVGDTACWLCGIEELMYLTADQPGFVRELLGLIAQWNARRMEVMLEVGVDLFIRRGWYESTEFWSPKLYDEFLLPSLKADAEATHQAGAKFGYIMTSGSAPLLDMIMDAGVDVLIGVDPVQGRGTELAEIKRRTVGRMALWGGVNGFLTVEQGEEQEVREAVRQALSVLAPAGGFILSPVDNVTADTPTTWRNVAALIDEWQKFAGARG
jgi:uroporphyrinogen-III decarboxylase